MPSTRRRRKYDYKRLIIAAIRKIWLWSPQRKLAIQSSMTHNDRYVCAACKTAVKKDERQVDHLSPVIPITGWVSWDSYIENLMEGPLQILCKTCHKTKTQNENKKRKKTK